MHKKLEEAVAKAKKNEAVFDKETTDFEKEAETLITKFEGKVNPETMIEILTDLIDEIKFHA